MKYADRLFVALFLGLTALAVAFGITSFVVSCHEQPRYPDVISTMPNLR
jgi:hypothetical protein